MSDFEKIPRLTRMTSILLKLQTKSYVSVKELASHFEVTTRTIYRDLLALEQSGVPLVSIENKGYSLIEGYNIPPVMFTEGEANALIIAEQIIAKTKDESLIEEFTSAVEKIKSVLRREEKEKSEFLSERIIIGKNWSYERSSSYLTEIQMALTNLNPLQIEYQKEKDSTTTSRIVEPFAIYHNTFEYWVLIAWCRLRKDFRNFRIDRIQKLQRHSEKFEPHSLTLEEYVEIQRKKHFGEENGEG